MWIVPAMLGAFFLYLMWPWLWAFIEVSSVMLCLLAVMAWKRRADRRAARRA